MKEALGFSWSNRHKDLVVCGDICSQDASLESSDISLWSFPKWSQEKKSWGTLYYYLGIFLSLECFNGAFFVLLFKFTLKKKF